MKTWWKNNYSYIVSSIIIIVSLAIVLIIKECWPFGWKPLLRGDYVGQTVPFVLELRRKLISRDSLIFTWNAGMGTNYIATIAYGLCSPFVLPFFLIPDRFLIKAGVLIYLIVLLCMNAAMIVYLTHRPNKAFSSSNPMVIVLSLAYTMCAYMISFMDVWYYLSCAVFFPLILLGIEQVVYQGRWKLYAVSLFLAFLCNYYLAGLLCVFIILYYFVQDFSDWKHFFGTSLRMLGLSVCAILATSVVLLPTVQQLRQTSSASSSYFGNFWFTTLWDEIQFFFSFQQAGFIGSGPYQYGDNQLFFGIFALLLVGIYCLTKEIPWKERAKKIALLLFYFLAFNLNGLNYILHLGHYPNFYPNRFSIFFTLLCIVLAADAWNTMEGLKFRGMRFGKLILLGLGNVILVALCFLFASRNNAQYTYYFTIILFLVYTIMLMLLSYFKKIKIVLVSFAILELALNFVFMLLTKEIYFSDFMEKYSIESFMEQSNITESHGFSRVSFGDIPPSYNQGLLSGYKDISFFSSSMILAEDFFRAVGLERTTNGLKGIGWNYVTNAMLNIEYQVVDWDDSFFGTSDYLYSDSTELFYGYEYINQQDNLTIYRNPTVLSLGYMVDPAVENLSFDYSDTEASDITFCEKINTFVSAMGGCGDVLTNVDPEIDLVETDDCVAAIIGKQWVMGESNEALVRNGLDVNRVDRFSVATISNLPADPYMYITYVMPENGYYYAETNGVITPIGYVRAGDPVKVYLHLERNQITATGIATGWLNVYLLQEEEWAKAYDKLSQQQMEVTEYDSTHIRGTIDVKENGLLFTSIPYDDNWHLRVDGVESDMVSLWNDTFIAVDLTEGEHTIELEYRQKWLIPGIIISVFMFGGFIFSCIRDYRKQKQDS